jgi:cysteinyl-tRNA synthetase
MSEALLGPSFDIHGGGSDLTFPHHENEVAQSCCANPDAGFANYWLHNEMLQVEGKKMSKSLGNFFTVRDLLDQGVPGEVIRFVFLGTHYRKTMDWTAEKAAQARERLSGWFNLTDNVLVDTTMDWWITEELSDDLNTAGAIAKMHQLAKGATAGQLKSAMRLLGLPDAESVEWFRQTHLTLAGTASTGVTPLYLREIQSFLEDWQSLRMEKKYVEADVLKNALEATGLIISNSKFGPTATVPAGFDIAKLEALK